MQSSSKIEIPVKCSY